jgi:hypothetical protein
MSSIAGVGVAFRNPCAGFSNEIASRPGRFPVAREMAIERQDVHGGGLERHVLSVVRDSRRRRHHAEKQRRHRGDEAHAEANDVLRFLAELIGRQAIANKRAGERAAEGARHGDRSKGGGGQDEVGHLGA